MPEQLQRAQMSFRVMTYNVHGCRGRDRRWSPTRIARVIADCQPDIVALQELDVRRGRSGNIDQASHIARLLEMEFHFYPSLKAHDGEYGNAILSRLPSSLKRAAKLPSFSRVRPSEPRSALWAEVKVNDIRAQVINTHLGLLGVERMTQVEALLSAEWLGNPECKTPVLFVGDFNATPRSRTYRAISKTLRDAQRQSSTGETNSNACTFPTRYPSLALDHVFVSSNVEVLYSCVVRTPLAQIASDHFPLVVDFRLSSSEPTDYRAG